VDVLFDTAATALITDPTSGAVIGVEVVNTDSASVHKKITIAAGAVILAAGGLANPQLRAP
jgi:Choline dehydrogenase and related flavoproteins